MDTFMQVFENRAPHWTAETAWLFSLLFIYVLALAALCGARRWRLAGIMLLFSYIYNVLVTTLLMREPAEQVRYTLRINFIRQVFLEHNEFAAAEALLNFLLLFPVGLFMPILLKKYATLKTCLFGFALTVFIEVTQLVSHLGELQADDLILNYLGCCTGAWLLAAIGETVRKISLRRKKIDKTSCNLKRNVL